MAINWHCVTPPLVRPVHTDRAAVQLVFGLGYSDVSSCYGAVSFLLFSLIQGKTQWKLDTKESRCFFDMPPPCRSGGQSEGHTAPWVAAGWAEQPETKRKISEGQETSWKERRGAALEPQGQHASQRLLWGHQWNTTHYSPNANRIIIIIIIIIYIFL